MKYYCKKCGKCCRNLKKNEMYRFLDNGEGVCRYLDQETNLCTIYESRPIICNIDEYYKKFFKGKISKYKYYELNYKACEMLEREE